MISFPTPIVLFRLGTPNRRLRAETCLLASFPASPMTAHPPGLSATRAVALARGQVEDMPSLLRRRASLLLLFILLAGSWTPGAASAQEPSLDRAERPWTALGGPVRTGLTHPVWDAATGLQLSFRRTLLRHELLDAGLILSTTVERMRIDPIAADPDSDPPILGRRKHTLRSHTLEFGAWGGFRAWESQDFEIHMVPQVLIVGRAHCVWKVEASEQFGAMGTRCGGVARYGMVIAMGLETVLGRTHAGFSAATGLDQFFRPRLGRFHATRTRFSVYGGWRL